MPVAAVHSLDTYSAVLNDAFCYAWGWKDPHGHDKRLVDGPLTSRPLSRDWLVVKRGECNACRPKWQTLAREMRDLYVGSGLDARHVYLVCIVPALVGAVSVALLRRPAVAQQSVP